MLPSSEPEVSLNAGRIIIDFKSRLRQIGIQYNHGNHQLRPDCRTARIKTGRVPINGRSRDVVLISLPPGGLPDGFLLYLGLFLVSLLSFVYFTVSATITFLSSLKRFPKYDFCNPRNPGYSGRSPSTCCTLGRGHVLPQCAFTPVCVSTSVEYYF